MTLSRTSISLLLTLAALAVPATASASIYPLSRADTTGALSLYGFPHTPDGGASRGFTGSISHARWFRVTVAWDSSNGDVLVGCRGHGSARVSVWLAGHRSGAVTSRCENLSSWRAWLLGVGWRSRVEASMLITPNLTVRWSARRAASETDRNRRAILTGRPGRLTPRAPQFVRRVAR